ncbi:MAG: hypothetical protein JJT76_17235 [Clostridiaceae bacterium]|nr:hypothetical protein [Clostridiaceae bacterium]
MITEGLELITKDTVTTLTGAVIVTNIITHFVKDYTPEFLDKKIVALLVAAFIMFANQCIFGTFTIQSVYMSFLNSFIVAAAAMGNYEILTKKTKRRIKKDLQLQELNFKEEEQKNEVQKDSNI